MSMHQSMLFVSLPTFTVTIVTMATVTFVCVILRVRPIQVKRLMSDVLIFRRKKYQTDTNHNKVGMLHVRLTELHAAHQNLPCYLLTY